jgi:hypothetical protein
VIAAVVLVGIGATLPPPIAFPVTVLLLLLIVLPGAFGIWLRLRWTDRALDEFGGVPMPGLLGLAGYDIESDPEAVGLSAKEFVQQVESQENPGKRGAVPRTSRTEGSGSTGGSVCAVCGALTPGPDSTHCRMCGAIL